MRKARDVWYTGGAMFKVAIILSLALKGSRSTCRGILDYARRRGGWRCSLMEGRIDEQRLDFARLGFSGVIAESLPERDARRVAAAGIPVVIAEPWPETRRPGHPLANAPFVKMDSRAVGALAAEYYLARGYRSFAYVGETLGMYWSAERRDGFRDALAAAGFGCSVYEVSSARERRDWHAERPRMMKFLASLPRPAAVFAAMDGRARLVIDACSEAGLQVPEEIAVLGVDDDPILCESTVPPLSSIRTGGFRRGQRAAAMLDDLMNGRDAGGRSVVMEPLSVVTRESTGYDAMRDAAMARALRFINAEAAVRRVSVMDAVRAAGCSRRHLETRFRDHLGGTIREAILKAKLDRVRTLLEQSNLSIGEIAGECGFMSESRLAVLFREAEGVSMREYRRRNRDTMDD